MYSYIIHRELLINKSFLEFLEGNRLDDFQSLMDYNGAQVLKKNKYRSVTRIELQGRIFYLKRHFWPLKERIKNRIPWVKKEDGKNEWENINLLRDHGFSTMVPVAFGEKRELGLPSSTLTLTENIYDAEKLETYLPAHFNPPLTPDMVMRKRNLIKKIAVLARDFHKKGFNHQDFYLGHLFIRPADNTIFIVDLQRMHCSKSTGRRYIIKDLAQIAYSAESVNIFSRTDFIRFAHVYFERDKLNGQHKRLIRKIMAKVRRIARHDAKLQMRKGLQKMN